MGNLAAAVSCADAHFTDEFPPHEPQLITSSRLLKLGEEITFTFIIPPEMTAGSLEVFARYLELADPGSRFRAGGDLEWLDTLTPETFLVRVEDGRARLTYRPGACGNYLARWRAGGETFIRYFAVIEDDWVVLRFSSFEGLDPDPSLHGTGVPFDLRPNRQLLLTVRESP